MDSGMSTPLRFIPPSIPSGGYWLGDQNYPYRCLKYFTTKTARQNLVRREVVMGSHKYESIFESQRLGRNKMFYNGAATV